MTISKLAVAVWTLVVFVVGNLSGAFVIAFFSGVGLDVDRIGREMGANLVAPSRMETASLPKPEDDPARKERERIKQEVASARNAAKKAVAAYDTCVAEAKKSLLKMWDPDFHCAEEKLLKLAAEARYEAWK